MRGRLRRSKTVAAFVALMCCGQSAARTQSIASPVSVPGSPVGLSSSVSGSTVTLMWVASGASDPATSYVVEAGTSSGAANIANFDTGTTATTLTATGVPPATYFVRVRAKNAAGVSSPSNEITLAVGGATSCGSAPGAPTSLGASINGSTVALNWLAASSGCTASGYILEAGSSPGANNLASVPVGAVSSFVAGNVGAGTYFVRVRATNPSGTSAPSSEVTVTVGAGSEATTFTDGASVAYIQRGSFRVGIDKNWGGAIREIWFQNSNLVNNHDGGRLVGLSVYDGYESFPSPCCNDPNWGWNPTPSDKYDHSNPPLEYSFSGGVLYVRDRHLHWNPDNKGGGRQAAAPSDVVVESWTDLLGSNPGVVHIRYRLTHLGNDEHGPLGQELPFVYVRRPYENFVRYSGSAPWTSAPVDIGPVPGSGASLQSAATELWAGFVDSSGVGLVLWAPQSAPQHGYFCLDAPGVENSTCYISPFTTLAIGPGFTYQSEVYLVAGRWQDARANIYALHQQFPFPDVNPPQGNIESPRQNARVSGTIDVSGWTIDNSGQIARVEIVLDGTTVGQATFGRSRPDVLHDYPGFPNSDASGFVSRLDTRAYSNGAHTIRVRVIDAAGNAGYIYPGPIHIDIQN